MPRIRLLLAPLVLLIALLASPPALAEAPTGSISGTVTSGGGGELSQPVLVSARQGSYNANWIAYADARTGEYTIDGLPAGSYLVYFMPVVTDIFTPQYREQLFDGVYRQAEATRIEITAAGETVAGVDAVMTYEDPVAALACVDPHDRAAVRALPRQFVALGGSLTGLTRADLASYAQRCL
ncbi:hypothetical protein HQQ81_04655 [Microbacteriaceae bacterium VKM Ac-2854]|nr:hypothetical protein [Microbacteriaceae bacterium VKM Ac-2854]